MAPSDPNDAVSSLRDELAALGALIRERVNAEDPVKKQAFDQLYSELQAYKGDWQYQAEKPLLLDLLLFYDSLNWFQESLVKQEMSRDVVADSFQYLIDEFLELLYRRDVVPVAASPTFDRRTHKAVQVVDTPDPSNDQKIQQVLKRGFQRGERILRAEEVIVQRHRNGSDG